MNAVVPAAQSQLFLQPVQPLIERVVALTELIPGVAFPILSYPMRYDLCAGLKKGDWEAMTTQEKRDLKEYYSSHVCPGVTQSLVPKINEAIQEVAKKMHISNPDQFSVDMITKDLSVRVNVFNQIAMNSEYAFALNGWDSDYSRQEVLGVIAHEMAHRDLRHVERIFTRILESNGIQVESEDVALEFLRARATGFRKLPETESGRKLVQSFLEFAGKRDPETVLQEMADAAEKNNPELRFSRLNYEIEKEADLHTLGVPDLTRGLRDSFVNEIDRNESACAQDPKLSCSWLYEDIPTHPSRAIRADYLTRELCREYPERNQDICPETLKGYLRHKACPR